MRRLDTIEDIRRLLAHVVREVEHDRIDLKKAKLLIYAGQTLAGVIRDNELEQRILSLEEALPKGKAK